MKTVALSQTQQVKLKNGVTFWTDRWEEHDDHILFFRHPIGLVYSATREEILTFDNKEDYDSNSPH